MSETQTNQSGETANQTSQNAATDDPFTGIVGTLAEDERGYIEKAGYKDVGAIVRTAMSAEQKLGADPSSLLRVPSQSRAENPGAWAEIDKAMGVPADGVYPEWKPSQGELNASEEGLKAFDGAMLKAGAPAAVRNAALETFHNLNSEALQAHQNAVQQEKAQGAQELQREWGLSFAPKLQAAGLALNGIEGEQKFNELMNRYNLQDHPDVMRVLSGVAALRAESGVPDGGDPKNQGGELTPAEAEAKKAELHADAAFMKRYDAGEDAAIKQMLVLNTAIAKKNS